MNTTQLIAPLTTPTFRRTREQQTVRLFVTVEGWSYDADVTVWLTGGHAVVVEVWIERDGQMEDVTVDIAGLQLEQLEESAALALRPRY